MTKADFCACHFYHRDFERCKLLDRHLAVLCRRYPDTRFIRISAPVRLLPDCSGPQSFVVSWARIC